MDIDPDIANWVLEFLLRQPLEDRALSSLLRTLPLPANQPNLKKSLLLKKLESEASRHLLSERMLDLLEQLEEIEFRKGNAPASDAMKRAYCAVAVECTVKILRDGDDGDKGKKFDFFEAVKRVWRGRIGRMTEVVGKGGLSSEQLWAWKDEIEAAVWDDGVSKSLVKKIEAVNGVEAVSAYIMEEREIMGPSFLEMVAESMKSGKTLQGILGVNAPDQVARKEAPLSGVDGAADGSNSNRETQKRKIKLRDKLVGLRRIRSSISGNSRGAKIVDSEKMINGLSNGRYNVPGSEEVKKVRESLESSSLELHAVVKDPLPDALKLAETISGEARNNKHQNPTEDNHVKSNSFVVDAAGVVQSVGGGFSRSTNGDIRNVPRPNLMERNISAHTYEWDDSIDASHEDPTHRSMVRLHTPRRINTSALDRYETNNVKKRRRGRRWSLLEEDALRVGVEKYGKGNWKLILTANRDTFEGRTEVDLKDKWRNLTR